MAFKKKNEKQTKFLYGANVQAYTCIWREKK